MDEDLNTCTVAVVADYEFFSSVGNGQESTVNSLEIASVYGMK